MKSEHPSLSDADARVLDALMEDGFDASRVQDFSGADRARAESLSKLLQGLDRLPGSVPAPSLIPALMARVDEAEHAQRERMRVRPAGPTTRRLRIPDMISIAAVLLVAVGVGWPLISTMRSASQREQCERNLVSVSAGLDQYATNHDGRLPLTAGFAAFLAPSAASGAGDAPPATIDWRRHRHSDNLELLRTDEYVGARCLTCPGCAKERGALALRVPAAGQRFTRTAMTGMLVADANPAIDLLCEGQPWRSGATVSSLNHRSRGQNILFDDGSVRWLLSPILPNGDSIWVPRDQTDASALENGALPADPKDIFLAQ